MLRILLVEDNHADARLTGEILKDTGLEHELVWINEGRKALELIASDGSFDLFILDLNLPKTSGLEVMADLRRLEKYRRTPVILLTGSRSLENTTTAGTDAPVHYLVKPMTLEEIDRTAKAIKDIVLGNRAELRSAWSK